MYEGNWDPEGILSTIPAIASTITGMFTGYIILSKESDIQKLVRIFASGFLMLISGVELGWFFPINKNLWTSSYVLYTSGLANLGLATIYYFMDVKGHVRWGKTGIIFGTNAITAYIIHYLLMMPLSQINIGSASIQAHFMNLFASMHACHARNSFSCMGLIIHWYLFYSSLDFISEKNIYKNLITL